MSCYKVSTMSCYKPVNYVPERFNRVPRIGHLGQRGQALAQACRSVSYRQFQDGAERELVKVRPWTQCAFPDAAVQGDHRPPSPARRSGQAKIMRDDHILDPCPGIPLGA